MPTNKYRTYSIRETTLIVMGLCLLIYVFQNFATFTDISLRLILFLAAVAGFWVVFHKYVKSKQMFTWVALALLFFHSVIPGIVSHVWHKLSSRHFQSTVNYLVHRAAENDRLFLWNASAVHACDASLMHDFLLSEVFHHYKTDNVTFVPGPQYPREDCVKAAQSFRNWQTRFFPASLRGYEEKIDRAGYLILSPESGADAVGQFVGGQGRTCKVVYSAKAGPAWDFLYFLARRFSRYAADAPGYVVLEVN